MPHNLPPELDKLLFDSDISEAEENLLRKSVAQELTRARAEEREKIRAAIEETDEIYTDSGDDYISMTIHHALGELEKRLDEITPTAYREEEKKQL